VNTAIISAPQQTSLSTPNERARQYARKSKASNTLRAYQAAWAEFQNFAAERSQPSLPASVTTVIDYITRLADSGVKVSTIQMKLAAIAAAHRAAKQADPSVDEDVRVVMAGIRRELRTAPAKKAPATLRQIRKMVAALPETLAGKRDKALLLVGFAGAFRRSELVDVDVADIRLNGKAVITVKRSKTDQEGKGQVKVIPALADKTICPVEALQAWLSASPIKSGPSSTFSAWTCKRPSGCHDNATAPSSATMPSAGSANRSETILAIICEPARPRSLAPVGRWHW